MNKLNITSQVLDNLGFSEYLDEHCTWGGRTLTFSNGTKFRIIEQCENEDDSDYFYFVGWFAIPKSDAKYYDLFFLHEMYVCIEECYPNCLEEFINKCDNLKMKSYITDFINERGNGNCV